MLKNNLSAIIISVSIIIGLAIIGNAYVKRGNANDTISVTGMGDEDFTSDLIVWRASFSKKAYELKDAYASLNADRVKIKK
jgi:hypothetical protein